MKAADMTSKQVIRHVFPPELHERLGVVATREEEFVDAIGRVTLAVESLRLSLTPQVAVPA